MPGAYPPEGREAASADPSDAVVVRPEDIIEPARGELILRGRAALVDTTHNPDDYVDPETERELLEGIPKNTRDAMAYQWGRFIWWCGITGRSHLPATPGTLRVYIREHWEMRRPDGRKRGFRGQPYSPATVEQAIYLISTIHQWFGYASPLRDPRVGKQVDRYRKKYEKAGFRRRQAYALTHDENVAIARTFRLNTMGGLRNALAARLQFDTGCRAGEMLALRLGDVTWESDECAVLNFVSAETKTGEERSTAVEFVAGVDEDVDPCRLLATWVWLLRAAGFTDPKTPLFHLVYTANPRKDGMISGTIRPEPWDYDGYEETFVLAAHQAGVDRDPETGEARPVTSHSNRAGHVTSSVDAGEPLERVAKRTGHSPASPTIHRYYRSRRLRGRQNTGTVIRTSRRKVAS